LIDHAQLREVLRESKFTLGLSPDLSIVSTRSVQQ
jgi:hypothetical protein